MSADTLIPEDIMATAAELVNATIRTYERNEFANNSRDAIAKAILAERERCATIAEGDAKSFDFQAALADGDDMIVGAQTARIAIAHAIRGEA